ncbi:MAG: hypothetical protein DCF26_21260 [Burkholderiales bacterium]|nr:MAG: hypothetical protein DCF26_21260 [Burkholderiales bacterium]
MTSTPIGQAWAVDVEVVDQNHAASMKVFLSRWKIEVRTLAQEGLAVLLTTHDPNQSLRCADRALIIREGTVMSQGPVRDVVTADSLRALYGAEVLQVASDGGQPAVFLPWIDVLQGQQQS